MKILFEIILPAVGDICLFFISVYTFRLTIFPKKLRFIGYRPSFSTFEGDSIEITLENRALSPAVIQSVTLVLDGNSINVFSEDDEDCEVCIIDGFKTGKIKMVPYSQIHIQDGELDFHHFKEWYLVVETPRGKQYLTFVHGPKKYFLGFHAKLHPPKLATVSRNYCNGKIIKPYIRYAVIYKDKSGDTHTIFIHQAGIMSEALFGYNALSKNVLDDKEKLYAHFNMEFSKYGIPFGIRDLADKDENIIIENK